MYLLFATCQRAIFGPVHPISFQAGVDCTQRSAHLADRRRAGPSVQMCTKSIASRCVLQGCCTPPGPLSIFRPYHCGFHRRRRALDTLLSSAVEDDNIRHWAAYMYVSKPVHVRSYEPQCPYFEFKTQARDMLHAIVSSCYVHSSGPRERKGRDTQDHNVSQSKRSRASRRYAPSIQSTRRAYYKTALPGADHTVMRRSFGRHAEKTFCWDVVNRDVSTGTWCNLPEVGNNLYLHFLLALMLYPCCIAVGTRTINLPPADLVAWKILRNGALGGSRGHARAFFLRTIDIFKVRSAA